MAKNISFRKKKSEITYVLEAAVLPSLLFGIPLNFGEATCAPPTDAAPLRASCSGSVVQTESVS